MVSFNRIKKAQAAMEFLMTYGWAILVVLIVIGALAYFGVLSPSTLLPEKCTFPVSLTCTDHQILTNSITLVMLNGAGRDMNVLYINTTSEALNTGTLSTSCQNTTVSILRNGRSGTFLLGGTGGSGGGNAGCAFRDTGRDKNRYNIVIGYNWTDSQNVAHSLSGDLLARKP